MTATPHAGKQEDFQLFLALLDGDRFEGRYRDGVHSVDTGRPDAPHGQGGAPHHGGQRRCSRSVAPTPSPTSCPHDETELYEAVTEYVREEMNRADRLKAEGEGRRGNTVGFALTVLQRRLASSPEAICAVPRASPRPAREAPPGDAAHRRPATPTTSRCGSGSTSCSDGRDLDDDAIDDLEDLAGDELEELEEEVVDAATAARTVAELETEIAILDDLGRARPAGAVLRHRPQVDRAAHDPRRQGADGRRGRATRARSSSSPSTATP